MSHWNSISSFISRRRRVVDGELEQGLLRIGIIAAMVVYLAVLYLREPSRMHTVALYSAVAFLVVSLCLLVWVAASPVPSRVRRVVGILHDIGGPTYGMLFFGTATVPFYIVYLWVIFGNGFRYGVGYLALATVASTLGFAAVITLNPYWQAHTSLGVGLLLGLVVLPAYVAMLLTRLNHAKQEAIEANQAKSRFLATMSHELRTPLNGVIGVVDLLRATPLNREQEDYARTIDVSAASLLALINDILDISKVEAGKMTLEEVDFDLHRLISNTVKMMAASAEAKGLKFNYRISPELPYALRGAEKQLQQVLINLLGNAIKFTDHGYVELSVGVSTQHVQDEAATWIRFDVIDTGIGIPREARARIFERFTQADESTTRRYGGSGLGTTISKQLIELMGGEIGVISQVDRGSTFWVEVPFVVRPIVAEKHNESLTLTDSRVLLVSSDPAESERVMALLAGWGVAAVRRSGNAQAIAELINAANHDIPYNTVVVDRRGSAPSDPLQLLQMVRHERVLQDPAFLLISAPLSDSNWKQDLLEAGFSAVLVTPFDKTLLFNALHSVYVSAADDPRVANFIDHYARERTVVQPLEVLVAEDNETNQKVVRGILEKAGHRVYVVDNGEQALDALETHRFDVALFDLQMPLMDGLEALKIYRFSHAGDQPIPVLMLSADVRPEARQSCIEAGAAAFISKPIQARTLLESLATVASGVGGPAAMGGGELAVQSRSDDWPRPVQMLAADVIDRQTLRNLEELGGGLEFVTELIEGFLQDAGLLLDQLQRTVPIRALRQFRDLAHALKGSAGSVGVRKLHALGDRACRISDRDFSPVASLAVSEMRTALAEADDALRGYIRERQSQVSRS